MQTLKKLVLKAFWKYQYLWLDCYVSGTIEQNASEKILWFNLNEFNPSNQKSLKSCSLYASRTAWSTYKIMELINSVGSTEQLLPIWSGFDALEHQFGHWKVIKTLADCKTIWLSKMRRQNSSWRVEAIITNLQF